MCGENRRRVHNTEKNKKLKPFGCSVVPGPRGKSRGRSGAQSDERRLEGPVGHPRSFNFVYRVPWMPTKVFKYFFFANTLPKLKRWVFRSSVLGQNAPKKWLTIFTRSFDFLRAQFLIFFTHTILVFKCLNFVKCSRVKNVFHRYFLGFFQLFSRAFFFFHAQKFKIL